MTIQIDTTDSTATLQAAAAAGIAASVRSTEGPSGWPEVDLTGSKEQLTAFLQAEGYEVDAYPELS